jgi:caa(3)-type oxidase subunit IV
MSAHSAEEIAREERRYFQVFFWLFVLTVAEIGITYVPIHKFAIGAMLVLLAGTKAAMVGLYYMHLASEKRTLMYIALTPAVLCVFLILMLLPDLGAITRLLMHAVEGAAGAAPAAH